MGMKHMKHLMKRMRTYNKKFEDDPMTYLDMQNADKKKERDEQKWAKKRKELKAKGIFDPYEKNGAFTERGIVNRFCPVFGNSFTQRIAKQYPVQFGKRRLIESNAS